jgi:hypothetical protein
MYSVLLCLLVVILAPIALMSLFRLLINPLFWGLLVICGLGLAAFVGYTNYENAKVSARYAAARQMAVQERHDAIIALYKRANRAHRIEGEPPYYNRDGKASDREDIASFDNYITAGGDIDALTDSNLSIVANSLDSLNNGY